MKKVKRLVAGALTLSMLFALASCGNGGGDGGNNNSQNDAVDLKDDQKAVVDRLAAEMEDAELENKTVKWLAHYDLNPNKGKVKDTALYLFEEKYGGKIEWVVTDWDNRYSDLAKQVIANDAPDMFPADDMDTFPKGAIKAMFQPIDDYVDLDSEVWASTKSANDQFMFNGSHYIAITKVKPSYVCIYNPQTIKAAGMEDPAQLYRDGKWDWDVFAKMCVDFTNPNEEKYGLDGYWYNNAISETCGVPLIGMQDGKISLNLKDPAVDEVQSWMYENLGKKNVVFPRAENNWDTRGEGVTGDGLASGLTLFIPTGLWAIEDTVENVKLFGDPQSNEIMFVPMPHKPGSDKYYISSSIQGYSLCNYAPNPEGYAKYVECVMRCSTDPDVVQIGVDILKDDYKWTDEMIEMRQEIYDLAAQNPVFDIQKGISDEVDALMNDVSQATLITGGNSMTWTQCVEANEGGLSFLINEANTKISEDPTK